MFLKQTGLTLLETFKLRNNREEAAETGHGKRELLVSIPPKPICLVLEKDVEQFGDLLLEFDTKSQLMDWNLV